MTENELRQRVLDQAKSWLGCKEADGSHRPIIDEYNRISPLPRSYRMTYSDPWCAAYVSAIGKATGLEDILFPECACDPMIAKYKAAGRWVEDDSYMPNPGDVIFYDWQDTGAGDNQGSSDHVGLVWSAYGDDITVIEGNCSDMVCFTYRKRNGRYIRGYGLPDYAGKADEAESPAVVIQEPKKLATCKIEVPVLMIGDNSEAVRAAQVLLEKRGFKCGWMGADGEFGTKTEAALGKFKVAYDLPRTPEIDGETWNCLIVGVVKKHD